MTDPAQLALLQDGDALGLEDETMNAKPTPGPWTVHDTASEGMMAHVTARAGTVALIGAVTPGEANANARLIAAAPDLLAWLIRCEEMVSTAKGPPNWDGIRAAIARATGADHD